MARNHIPVAPDPTTTTNQPALDVHNLVAPGAPRWIPERVEPARRFRGRPREHGLALPPSSHGRSASSTRWGFECPLAGYSYRPLLKNGFFGTPGQACKRRAVSRGDGRQGP